MNPFWSNRVWNMYICGDLSSAEHEPVEWVQIACDRYWPITGKWYGY